MFPKHISEQQRLANTSTNYLKTSSPSYDPKWEHKSCYHIYLLAVSEPAFLSRDIWANKECPQRCRMVSQTSAQSLNTILHSWWSLIGIEPNVKKIMSEQNKISPKIYGNVSIISLDQLQVKTATKGMRRALAFLWLSNKHSLRGVFLQQSKDNTESMLKYLRQPSVKTNRLGGWALVLIGH